MTNDTRYDGGRTLFAFNVYFVKRLFSWKARLFANPKFQDQVPDHFNHQVDDTRVSYPTDNSIELLFDFKNLLIQ